MKFMSFLKLFIESSMNLHEEIICLPDSVHLVLFRIQCFVLHLVITWRCYMLWIWFNPMNMSFFLPFVMISQVLKKEFPKGLDIIYESVGGDMFNLCLNALAVYGRLIVIGMISQVRGFFFHFFFFKVNFSGNWCFNAFPCAP